MPRFGSFFPLVALLSAGLRVVLPISDHHAAERDPWHTHVVIDAHSIQDYSRALAHHHHGHEQPHGHDPITGRPIRVHPGSSFLHQGPQAIPLASQPEGSSAGFAFEIPAWMVPTILPLVLPPAGVCWTLAASSHFHPRSSLPPPSPPPRASF
jgi:hypothetical protein